MTQPMRHAITHPSFDSLSDRATPVAPITATGTARRVVALLGRALFGLVFVAAAPAHFSQLTIDHAMLHGVPLANILVPAAGLMAFVGGLCVMLGFRTKIGAGILVAFLVPVTLSMHDFWNVSEPALHAMQHAMFMKNVALIGGALLLAYFGAGPLSIDARMALKTNKER